MSNPYDHCVYNKRDVHGVQYTITKHVGDLLITSTDTTMLDDVREALRQRYGDIKEQVVVPQTCRFNAPVKGFI